MDSFNDGMYIHGDLVPKHRTVNQYRASLFALAFTWLVILIGWLMLVLVAQLSWPGVIASIFAFMSLELAFMDKYFEVRKQLFAIAPEYEHTNRSDLRRARRASLDNHDLPPPD